MAILIVEDERSIREVEAGYLKAAGYEVREATDGDQALALLRDTTPNLVLLDLNLPGLDGLEVCRRIRDVSNVPIIMVTARTGEIDEIMGLDIGADDYLRKPFNPRILAARVEALLRRVGTRVITTGPFTLDPAKMLVHKRGEPVSLTTTQFNIFYRLVTNAGIVLTRDQLIDAAHGSRVAPKAIFDRTIDAHIRTLRRRIEDDPANPRAIVTVIGRGYRFVGQPDA